MFTYYTKRYWVGIWSVWNINPSSYILIFFFLAKVIKRKVDKEIKLVITWTFNAKHLKYTINAHHIEATENNFISIIWSIFANSQHSIMYYNEKVLVLQTWLSHIHTFKDKGAKSICYKVNNLAGHVKQRCAKCCSKVNIIKCKTLSNVSSFMW